MRIPNTAEIIAFFFSTGQLTSLSNQPGADLEALAETQCTRPPYTALPGDTCNTIAERVHVPTYQIICGNDAINGKCTNLGFGQQICLAPLGQHCPLPYTVIQAGQDARSIASQFDIPVQLFEINNYCNLNGPICPPFPPGTVVCVANIFIGPLPRCEKILV